MSGKRIIRWNNQAAGEHGFAICEIPFPPNLDDVSAASVHLLGTPIKAGGSAVDAPHFDIRYAWPRSTDDYDASSYTDVTTGGTFTANDLLNEVIYSFSSAVVPAHPFVLTILLFP